MGFCSPYRFGFRQLKVLGQCAQSSINVTRQTVRLVKVQRLTLRSELSMSKTVTVKAPTVIRSLDCRIGSFLALLTKPLLGFFSAGGGPLGIRLCER